jgi:hypothetical protein
MCAYVTMLMHFVKYAKNSDTLTKAVNCIFYQLFIVLSVYGAWGGVVVKALCYKSDGPGTDSRWCHWIFQ